MLACVSSAVSLGRCQSARSVCPASFVHAFRRLFSRSRPTSSRHVSRSYCGGPEGSPHSGLSAVARKKTPKIRVNIKASLSKRLREIRQELFGEHGGPELARRLS